MAELLKKGTSASGAGLLTEAPPNTGAGWYSLATGAWPGVHGSTNNTFHVNGQPFGNRTAAFDPGVLQAETIAQAAERGGKKVAQVEWAGGRNGEIDGPTIDFLSFFSGRGRRDQLHLAHRPGQLRRELWPAVRPPGRVRRPAAVRRPRPRPTRPDGSNVPTSFSPAKQMRLRVLDFGEDKYGLNAYLYDSTNDGAVDYDRVLFAPGKNGSAKVADLRQGELADVKVTIVGWRPGRQDRRVPGEGRGAHAGPVPGAAVPHLGLARQRHLGGLARRPGLPDRDRLRGIPRPALPDLDRGRLRGARGRHRQRGDLRRAGPLLGDQPPADAALRRDRPTTPTCCWRATRPPTSSSTSSSAWSARRCPTATPTRRTTTSRSTAPPTAGSPSGRRSSSGPTAAPTRP